MGKNACSVIIGSGSYIPPNKVPNADFSNRIFYDADGSPFTKGSEEIIKRFSDITGIEERRYAGEETMASDMAFYAAEEALKSAGVDRETLDYIIVAHNFGEVKAGSNKSSFLPALASIVKAKLDIRNSATVTYDVIFGCAGWLQALIQAHAHLNAGAQRIMVIGTETLSRVLDPHDRDSMIYADGAAAVILESRICTESVGILSHSSATYTTSNLVNVLRMEKSYNPEYKEDHTFLKMNGRMLYAHALIAVPKLLKAVLGMVKIPLSEVDKILIHQANRKMIEAIVERLFEDDATPPPFDALVPMTISWLGNSSVATVPTLYDLFSRNKLSGHIAKPGSVIVFGAIGAGINASALVYKIPF